MEDYTVTGIALVIVGVLLIVIGGGTAFAGMNKMDAAEDWEPPDNEGEDCTVTVEDSENKSIREAGNDAFAQCPETTAPENPYSGGERDVAFGSILVIAGGVSTYFGNKR